MKLGIISDTHDNLENIGKAIDLFADKKIEHILHAGDIVSPFCVKPFKDAGMKVNAVYGNNEGEWLWLDKLFRKVGEIRKGPVELDISGKKIALMHEPAFISVLAESGAFSLVIYGHTHEPHIEKKSGLIVNPGEACGYLTGKATVAICDLDGPEAELFEL